MNFPTILIVSMLVLCYAAGILILSAGIRQIRTGFAARNWPSTDARLEKCKVESRSAGEGVAYHLAVKYSYALAGVTYTGDTLAIGYNGSSDRAAHESFRNDLLALERFTVRYDPAHPEVSTIHASENALIFGTFVVGLIWMTFTLGFTVIVLAISGVGAAMLEWVG
jgi:hypothetical protein